MEVSLTPEQVALISVALRYAQQQFSIDADRFEAEHGKQHIARQFDHDSRRAMDLAEYLESLSN